MTRSRLVLRFPSLSRRFTCTVRGRRSRLLPATESVFRTAEMAPPTSPTSSYAPPAEDGGAITGDIGPRPERGVSGTAAGRSGAQRCGGLGKHPAAGDKGLQESASPPSTRVGGRGGGRDRIRPRTRERLFHDRAQGLDGATGAAQAQCQLISPSQRTHQNSAMSQMTLYCASPASPGRIHRASFRHLPSRPRAATD